MGLPNSVDDNRTYKIADIVRILNISISSAYKLVREENFKIVKIGKAIRISKKSFDEWLDQQ